MRLIDFAIIIVYLAGIVIAGLASRGREGDIDDYFTSKGAFSGKLGVILVGLSITATLFSGLSFVVYTSTAYSDGARILLGMTVIPIAYVVLKFWFLPRYLAAGSEARHPYDVVEQQLGAPVRLFISALFILMRLGWLGVMLAAPTLVVMGAGNLGEYWFWPMIAVTGLTCTLYTTLGGIRGVIVTDAIQMVIIIGGILLIAVFILTRVGVPLSAIGAELSQEKRLAVFDFTFDLTKPFTFWSIVCGLSIGNLAIYLGDLMMLQRYAAAGSPAAAVRSLLVSMWGSIIVAILLVVVGLLLWVWYRHHPDPHLPAKSDQVLAYFVAKQLPPGVSGLLIAAILAATMSSMTSGIIALAGVFTNDWAMRFGRSRTPQQWFRFGRWTSLMVGIFATVIAGFASQMGTVFELSMIVQGSFQGPMFACMIIVVGAWKVRPGAVLAGMILGMLTGWAVTTSAISVIWTPLISGAVALAVPVLDAWFGFRGTPAAVRAP